MPSTDIQSAIDAGFEKAKKLIADAVAVKLASYAEMATKAALNSKGFLSFTGNAENAIHAVTFANDSKIVGHSHPSTVRPLMNKIPYGKNVFLDKPVEGKPRMRRGAVDIEESDVYKGVAKVVMETPLTEPGTALARTRYIYAIEYGAQGKVAAPLNLMYSLAKSIRLTKVL